MLGNVIEVLQLKILMGKDVLKEPLALMILYDKL